MRDSFWAVAGNALGKGLSLLGGIIVARWLGSEVYGEYGVIKSNIMMIAIFSTLGMGYSSTKFVADVLKSERWQLKVIHRIVMEYTLLMSMTIALIVFVFSDRLAEWLDCPELSLMFKWTAPAIVFNAVTTSQTGVLAGLKRYKILARNTTITGVYMFMTSLIGAYFYQLTGALIALMTSYLINVLLNQGYISKEIAAEAGMTDNGDCALFRKKLRIRLLSYSVPIAMQESLYSITNWFVVFILVRMASYSEYGIYSAAVQWMVIISFIPGSLRNVALSYFAGNNGDYGANAKVLSRLSTLNLISTLLPASVILLCQGFIADFYGPSYSGVGIIISLLSFVAVLSCQSNILSQELMALDKNWLLFICRLVRDLLTVGGIVLLIRVSVNGALSASISMLVCNAVYLALLYFFHYRVPYTTGNKVPRELI